MMRALNTAGTGMVAQQFNMDVIANNLANVNTTAFKQQRAEFQDLMYQTFRASGSATGENAVVPQAAQIGLGARFSASAPNFSPGPLQNTGNPLDIAINGDGFLRVTLPDGSFAYTRDGSLKPDANGTLVTSDGYMVEPQVVIPPGTTALNVAPNGQVEGILPGTNEVSPLGQIQIVLFPNQAGLTRMGQNLFRDGGGSGAPVDATPGESGAGLLRSGFVEGSNVQVVEEMVRMILAQRAYEINSKAIQTSDEMLGILNNLKR